MIIIFYNHLSINFSDFDVNTTSK